MLESIIYRNNKLEILNQLLLPLRVEYESIDSVSDAWHAINSMKVRGAPAIAILAILSIARELTNHAIVSQFECQKRNLMQYIADRCQYLCSSRPTAVNIKKECNQLIELTKQLDNDSTVDFQCMIQSIIDYSAKILDNDIAVNKAIGNFGAKHIQQLLIDNNKSNSNISILTHCNTGSLATAGYGTALGVIRSLHNDSSLGHAYCTETRPYNQGSRLTSWELVHDQIPCTLICDNMVAALMSNRTIDAVVVGADRVVANGDTANKIGTYQIAILAKYHNVPFYVASPKSTIDISLKSGHYIPIEERPAHEMKSINGIQIATPEINCWNPAFDITPAELITGGIITEFGVFSPNQIENI